MDVIDTGIGPLFHKPDPDGHRAYIRQHKSRALIEKVMTEQEAVNKFVADGDYICYDCDYFARGPSSLVREIIRQKKKELSVGARFTRAETMLLAGSGCARQVDVGYIGLGAGLTQLVEKGVKFAEWSNSAITMRQLAGSLGIPFIPIRFLGGTDAFRYSGAKIVKDPFTGKEIVLVPALNPDIALIHVHQCDVYGNARILGPSVSPIETVTAAKKVIISTEEIIDTEYIRRDPSKTSIPYYLVDAVVEAPFGAHPGEVSGLYVSDTEVVIEVFQACQSAGEALNQYLEKYVYSVSSHQEYLEKRVGLNRLLQLKQKAKIKEGYYL
jgi:acyl CoA:acetate/3-ketoacid CoA transferase alpha subunit